MIRYGHPTLGVVDYGPANGRPKRKGAGPVVYARTSPRVIWGERITTPVRHLPSTRYFHSECCGNEVATSYPCPTCGKPAWPEGTQREFRYDAE